MIPKFLKATNVLGDSVTFGNTFKLYEDIDFSNLSADVSLSDSSTDGASYQSTYLSTRDIDVPFYIDKETANAKWYEEKRREIFKVFNPKLNPFRIDFVTDGNYEYYVTANLVSVPSLPTGFDNDNEGWAIALLQFEAADPYIYQKAMTTVQVATWVGAFKFPLRIKSSGIVMGRRSKSLIANVLNKGSSETGMNIRFKALASVTNPILINVNTYEQLKLNIDMDGGDIIEVSTFAGKEYIDLIRNNVRTDAFDTFDFLTSEFLQLAVGDNLIRYDADVGIDNLEVTITFTPRYTGV